MPIRQKHLLPFGIDGDWFSLTISTRNDLGIEDATQDCIWDAERDGISSSFKCFYDTNDNNTKKIVVNGVANNVLIDDVLLGYSSFYNAIGFQMSITDDNIAYVNFDGTAEANFPLGQENTILGATRVYTTEDFTNILQNSGNKKAVTFASEFSQAISSYSANNELCETLDFNFYAFWLESNNANTLKYDIKYKDNSTFIFSVQYLTDANGNLAPVVIDGITFDRRVVISENGAISTMLITSNLFVKPYQRSNYEAEKAVDNSLISQTPQPVGIFDSNTEIFYPNIAYDGIAIELITSADQITINDTIYSTSLFTGVSSNEFVVSRDLNKEKRHSAKKINAKANIKAEIKFEILDEKKIKSQIAKYKKSKREVSGLMKASAKFRRK